MMNSKRQYFVMTIVVFVTLTGIFLKFMKQSHISDSLEYKHGLWNINISKSTMDTNKEPFIRFHYSVRGPVFNSTDVKLNLSENRRVQQRRFELLKTGHDYRTLFHMLDIKQEVDNSILGSPLDYLSNFRNPCWLSLLDSPNPYGNHTYYKKFKGESSRARSISKKFAKRIQDGHPWRMRCLPSVFLCGIAKSGSTDLARSIFSHPEVAVAGKEFLYWNRLRLWKPAMQTWSKFQKRGRPNFSEYVDQFDDAADEIMQSFLSADGLELHHKITMDATPHYLFDYDGWEALSGNKGLSEPRYILAHTLKRIIPGARFIVILRRPTERLYSHFLMYTSKGSANLFHEMAVEVIQRWKDCLKYHTQRACAYNKTVNPYEYSRPGGFVLRASMYSIFLRDWMNVFPKSHFNVIFGDEYYKNRTRVLQNLFSFLRLKRLSDEQFKELEDKKVSYKRKYTEPMHAETNVLLDEFFKHFNRDLAEFLDDDRYLWQH